MEPGLRVNGGLVVPFAEIEVRTDPSGGPGGQHANRAATRVELRFYVETSSVLGPRQRARIIDRIGPVVVVRAGESRSQATNRARAFERLAAQIRDALVVAPPRRATRPTLGSKTRRLDAKRQRGATKRDRRKPDPD